MLISNQSPFQVNLYLFLTYPLLFWCSYPELWNSHVLNIFVTYTLLGLSLHCVCIGIETIYNVIPEEFLNSVWPLCVMCPSEIWPFAYERNIDIAILKRRRPWNLDLKRHLFILLSVRGTIPAKALIIWLISVFFFFGDIRRVRIWYLASIQQHQ